MIHPPHVLAEVAARCDETSESLFSYVDLEARIPARHPLRTIRLVVNEALVSLDGEFAALYILGSHRGRNRLPTHLCEKPRATDRRRDSGE